MSLHIGTSGWAYKEWKPAFYPEGTPQRAFLAHYSSVLTGCEINATFYRLPSESTVARWAEETPEAFRFAVKMHRRLTHSAELGDAGWRDFLARFLDSLAPLGERLGCTLIQFPASRVRDDGLLTDIIRALPPGLPFACEFRHESWVRPEVDEILADGGGTRCLAETDAAPPPAQFPPGPLTYVRLRGDRYPDPTRGAWATALRGAARTQTVFAFTKHKGVPAGDPETGVGLAEWLTSR